MKRNSVTVLAITAIWLSVGCQLNRSSISDQQFYETGELREDASIIRVSFGEERTSYGRSAEYFKDGRLRKIHLYGDDQPAVVLEFHSNGRLKSEEQRVADKLTFAVYYDENGNVERSLGERVRRSAQRDLTRTESSPLLFNPEA
jgi:hypothetical protein